MTFLCVFVDRHLWYNKKSSDNRITIMSVTRLSVAVVLLMIMMTMRHTQGQHGKLIDRVYSTHRNTTIKSIGLNGDLPRFCAVNRLKVVRFGKSCDYYRIAVDMDIHGYSCVLRTWYRFIHGYMILVCNYKTWQLRMHFNLRPPDATPVLFSALITTPSHV